MKPDYRSQKPFENLEEITEPASRFLDEKVADDSGAEAKSDSALAPAGLNNPFWN